MHRRIRPYATIPSFAPFTPPPPDYDYFCVDLNGTNEKLADNQEATKIGIDQKWTAMVWVKPQTSVAFDPVFSFGGGPTAGETKNRVTVTCPSTGGTDIEFQVNVSGGSLSKQYRYNGILTNDVWQQFVMTADATVGSGVLKVYKNGSLQTPDSKLTDGNMDRDDNVYTVWVGNQTGAASHGKFRVHSLAVWDVVLAADEITSIYNGGNGAEFFLDQNSGNYIQSANLIRWFRLGKDGSDIGADYAGTGIDLMNDATNITEGDDVVEDSPT